MELRNNCQLQEKKKKKNCIFLLNGERERERSLKLQFGVRMMKGEN